VAVTSTFAYSPLGSSVPDGAISTVADPEGEEAVGEGDGEGVGGGFGGRLASTAAVLAMTSATARAAAIWTLRCRDLITLRIGRLPTCLETRSTERYVAQ
jgi:hypothetical protein